MGLMDDLRAVFRYRGGFDPECGDAVLRLSAFISKHEPWYPPRQEGFGPWIEYKHGEDQGPPVMAKIKVLGREARENKRYASSDEPGRDAYSHYWGHSIVAYCVKLDEAKP